MVAFEMQTPSHEQTHLVKQSFSKEKYQSMSEDERNSSPILGGVKPFGTNRMESTNDYVADSSSFSQSTIPDDLPF